MKSSADPTTVKTTCPYCGVGCGMVLHVDNGQVVKIAGDKEHPTNYGRLCTKGQSAHVALRNAGRLESAFERKTRDQDPVPLPIAQAISDTALRLRAILDQHGPDALSFYVSGQMSIEAQYLINKLAKGFVGTNQIESNSRLCMASAGSGYKLSLGADGPPGSYEDFDRADLFFVIGANMADCHPILFLRMMDRVKAGARLIVVDPRRTATADKADLYLPIRPGTDLALLNGLLYLLHANGKVDETFIASFTQGWRDMPSFLADYTPERVARITGLDEAAIVQAATWIGEAPEWMSCWTMGLNQSTHGTWNTNAICNLHLATGAICRPGSGPFSLTGQPNAMGGREMGYMGPGLPGQRSVLVDADRAFVEQTWGIASGTLRTDVGGGTIDMFERMAAGEIKACWIICTNPVASVANRQTVMTALQTAEFVVTQDAFLDTETNRYADVLLPGALWAEGEGVMINSERNLTLMRAAIDPPGDALPDWQIIANVACEMGFAHAFTYASAEEVFEEIKRFSNEKTGYDLRGVSYAKLRETPLQWPCAPDDADVAAYCGPKAGAQASTQARTHDALDVGPRVGMPPSAHDRTRGRSPDRNAIRYLNHGISQLLRTDADGQVPRLAFPTPSGKAQFLARPHVDPVEMPDEDFPFVLNTGRLQHQWHTMTKTGKVAMLNKLNPEPFVEIHPEDAAALHIQNRDRVEIRSRRGRAVLPAVVTDRVRPGNAFAPMHWNDVYGDDLCINAVTSDAVDAISQQPELKVCAVALTRVHTIVPAVSAAADTATPDSTVRESAMSDSATSGSATSGFETSDTASSDTAPSDTASSDSAAHTLHSEDSLMPQIDTLSRVLELPAAVPPALSAAQNTYLAGFVAALRASPGMAGVPVLPPSAPFADDARLWVNGLLAGLYSRDASVPHALAAPGVPGALPAQDPTQALLQSGGRDTGTALGSDAATALATSPVQIVRSRPKVILLWASQTGNVESLTEAFAMRLMESGFEIRVTCMADFAVAALAKAQYVLLMTSTFGDGDAPDNGQAFWDALSASTAPQLESLRYGVLAFGDSNYDQFCGHGRKLDERFAALGAKRLLDRADCDTEFQAPAEAWLTRVTQRVKEEDAALHAVDDGGMIPPVVPGAVATKARPARSRLLANRRLNRDGAAKDTRYVSLNAKDVGLEYEAGDALGVWPTHCPELVDELLDVTGLDGGANVNVPGAGEMALADALRHHYEIARPSHEALALIADRSSTDGLKALLADERKADLKQWLWGQQLADVLHEYPAALSPDDLLGVMRRMQPRLYSIASSPKAHAGEIHLTVSAVRYSNGRRSRKGVASTFLADRAEQIDVPVFVQKSAHFRPPHHGDTPMLMVGPGTGVAPFRAFLHERRARGHRGRNWLFFGEQHAATDFYYGDELEGMRQDGFLTRLDVAFSRDQDNKIYVQDRMREQGADIWAWLEEGAHFYVCGDASRMAKDVDAALRTLVAEHGGMSADHANEYVARMAKDKRYVRDVY